MRAALAALALAVLASCGADGAPEGYNGLTVTGTATIGVAGKF